MPAIVWTVWSCATLFLVARLIWVNIELKKMEREHPWLKKRTRK